jgi:hypothetical protein
VVRVTVSFRRIDRFKLFNWRRHAYLRHWRSIKKGVLSVVRQAITQ